MAEDDAVVVPVVGGSWEEAGAGVGFEGGWGVPVGEGEEVGLPSELCGLALGGGEEGLVFRGGKHGFGLCLSGGGDRGEFGDFGGVVVLVFGCGGGGASVLELGESSFGFETEGLGELDG